MEDLNVTDMMKNHKLARSIQDVSWYELVKQLKYKAEWSGRDFIRVDKFFPSSKTCYNDGFIIKDLYLSQREWACPKCGEIHDRDINAAKNILKQGLNISSGSGTLSDDKQNVGRRRKENRKLKHLVWTPSLLTTKPLGL
jgi:putative transposase